MRLFKHAALLFICQISMVLRPMGQTSSSASNYIWDLAPSYYRDHAAWQAEKQKLQQLLEAAGRTGQQPGNSPKALASMLDRYSELRSIAHKMSVYGFLHSSVQVNSAEAQAELSDGELLEAAVESGLGFIETTIQKIKPELLNEWLKKEPALQKHRHWINAIVAVPVKHRLNGGARTVLDRVAARWPSMPGNAYLKLIESEIGWPSIRRGADTITVNPAAFADIRTTTDTGLLAAAKRAYFAKLRPLEETFGLLVANRIEADLELASLRNFESGIDALLSLHDGLPVKSFGQMLAAAREGQPVLRAYFETRNRALGLESRLSNLYVPAPIPRKPYPVELAQQAALQIAEKMGPAYHAGIANVTRQPWFHLAPSDNKRVTYGIYWPIGRGNTYTIMDYRDRFVNSRAYVSALMLALAYESIPKSNLPDNKYDPGIYSNAVLYVGNLLHDRHYIDRATDTKEKIAYLISCMDRIYKQYYQYIILGELEQKIESAIIARQTPSGAEISKMYGDLLRDYFGVALDGKDSEWTLDWVNTANLFFSYDHLYWPPAMAAACFMEQRVNTGDRKTVSFLQDGLRQTNVYLSYPMFASVGVDLSNREVYRAVNTKMRMMVDELNKLLAETN